MFSTMVSVSDLAGVKELFPSSPGASESTTRSTGNLNTSAKPSEHSEDYHHRIVIKTPSRTNGDEIEAQLETTFTTPIQSVQTVELQQTVSPISHASSVTNQELQRDLHEESREPPSPFKLGPLTPNGEAQPSMQNGSPIAGCLAPTLGHNESTSGVDDSTGTGSETEFVDLTGFFILLQRREWKKVLEFLLDNPNASKQTIQSQNGVTPLLHIVLRHGPPITVLNVLLSQDHGGKNKSHSIWKQADMNGRLPLHAACSCGPDARVDVISKIVKADPDALRTPTKNKDGRLPLHLAVVTNASEKVVLELLTHYPDASFLPDAHGKIALEYARNSCYGHNRLVVALEWAPMLVTASKAGCDRITSAYETKLDSLRQAHASYEDQLRGCYEKEKMELTREQIQSNHELTSEKERNIVLAEALLETRKSNKSLIQENEELQKKLDRELLIRRTRMTMRDEELKRILLGNHKSTGRKGKDNDENNNTTEEQNVQRETSDDILAEDDEDCLLSSSSKTSVSILLRRMVKGYESSKQRNQSYKELLDRQRDTVRNLNLLLSAKEDELRQSNRRSRNEEVELKAANERVDQLASMHRAAVADLAKARAEVEELQRVDSERARKLAHSERRLKIQERRLTGVQSLIASLNSLNDDSMESLEEDKQAKCNDESVSTNDNKPAEVSALAHSSIGRKENEVSVEIEMVAAQFECYVLNSSATQQREVDLSTELAAESAINNSHSSEGRLPNIPEELHTDNTTNTMPKTPPSKQKVVESTVAEQKSIDDKGLKWSNETPQTLSIRTVTTATGSEDIMEDEYIQLCIPQTPPIPKQVGGRGGQEYDVECSPILTPTLDLTCEI